GRRGPVARAPLPPAPGRRPHRRGARHAAPPPARSDPRRHPTGRRPHGRLHRAPQARRPLPALRHRAAPRPGRRAHDVLVPEGAGMTDAVALVTGANRGIGAAIAQGLAEQGLTVLAAMRDVERGGAAARAIGATPVALDVTDQASVDAAFGT